MYNSISNLSECPVKENNEKSIICSQVEAGNVSPGQLLCCYGNTCVNDLKACLEYSDRYMAKCYNVATLDACRRTDAIARRVCEWKNNQYCLSVRSTLNVSDYAHLHEAIEWIINRNKVEESYNITACLETGGYQYQICNNTIGTINFSCNDMFEGGCNTCEWRNGVTVGIRRIKGELCEVKQTITSTITTIVDPRGNISWDLIIGLNIIIGCLFLGAVILVLFLKLRSDAKKILQIAGDKGDGTDGDGTDPDGGS